MPLDAQQRPLPLPDMPPQLLGIIRAKLPERSSDASQAQQLAGLRIERPGRGPQQQPVPPAGDGADMSAEEAGGPHASSGGSATLEVVVKSVSARCDALTQALADTDEAAADARPAGWGDSSALGGYTWQAGGPGGGGHAAVAVVESLVDDCLLRQMALERLVRQLDTAGARLEMASWRMADSDNKAKYVCKACGTEVLANRTSILCM